MDTRPGHDARSPHSREATSPDETAACKLPRIHQWSRQEPPCAPPPGCRRVRVPFYGYRDVSDEDRLRVERFFHWPMLVLALAVLPILAFDYWVLEHPRFHHPAWTWAVNAAMILIWLAFLIEFIVKITIAQSRAQYAARNWLDILIIVLPMLRPFRATRALRTAQVARLSAVYTLRGVVMKFLRMIAAVVLGLEGAQKLMSRFSKPHKATPPDYQHWPRSSLIAELHRLRARNQQLETELRNASASKKAADGRS